MKCAMGIAKTWNNFASILFSQNFFLFFYFKQPTAEMLLKQLYSNLKCKEDKAKQ